MNKIAFKHTNPYQVVGRSGEISGLSVLAVPAFNDNYLWLVHDRTHAIAIDPGDAVPILAALDAHQLSLAAILLTHHHADHIGGVPDLLLKFKVPVFGPPRENIATITHPVSENDMVTIPELGLTLDVLDVPGHTRGHIAYVASKQGWLFCGDTLFAGGCGRLFEGTPEQMAASLSKLTDLPDSTQVYCAHEYTLSNLRFAQEVEPDNPVLASRIQAEQAKRAQNIPTVPSTIGLEKATNPFLRYREPAIQERLIADGRLNKEDSKKEPISAFAALRSWKNTF
jgi:hydroxyacylglutathione hydrolase